MSSECLKCYNSLKEHTAVMEEAKPVPGDYTVCVFCGVVYEFGESLELLLVEDDAIMEIAAEHPAQFQMLMQLSYSIKKTKNDEERKN
jgi:hypothetical protein